jgi:hypothetical protein
VSRFRLLDAVALQCKACWFNRRPLYMQFMAHKVIAGQACITRVFRFPFSLLFHYCSLFNLSPTTDVLWRPTEYPQLHPATHCVNLWPVWSNESCRIPTNKYYTNVRDSFSYSDCNNILLHSTQLSTTAQTQHQITQGYCLWIKKTDIDINACR